MTVQPPIGLEPVACVSTLPGVLERAALTWPDVPALTGVAGGPEVTYGRLLRAARAFACSLVGHGVRPGDRVALWLPNGPDWAIAAYGIACAGAVAVPLNPRYTIVEAADIIGRAGCAVAVAHGALPGRDLGLDAARAGATAVLRPGVLPGEAADDADAEDADADRAFRVGIVGEVERRMRSLTADDISHVQYTSGTTGRPKGALLRHGAMVATTRSWVRITGLREGDRYPVVAPFSHIGGHKTGLLACAVAGATALPQPTLDVPALVRAIEEQGVTFLQGPPAMYQALLERLSGGRSHVRGRGRVRVAVTGAASVPPSLVRDLRAVLGVRAVFTAYGLTEASGVCTMTGADDEIEIVARTAGRAIPGVEVRIDGPEAVGEVLVRGAGLMAGYLDDPEATAEALRDGWLRTGDVGTFDAAGRLRIVDRLKDIVIVGGLNAYPAEIERVLLEHPAIRQAAVVGIPHERLGEVPAAFVVGERPPAGGVDPIEFCESRLAGFKVPRSLWWVESLPLNAAGKVAKPELRAAAARRASG